MEAVKNSSENRLRMAGIIILVLGFVGAGLVYWLSPAPEDLPPELSAPGNFKTGARDMKSNFGEMGAFSNALSRDMRDPTIQSCLIALGATVVAGGCFLVAELKGRGGEHPQASD